MAKREAPEVNAGSMADIAFLLLIFFLVTTTIETDSGINRKLPPIEEIIEPPLIKEKNVFTVMVNRNNQLLVRNEIMEINDLRQAAIDFLDNNADGSCSFCQGKRDASSSDNPQKAVISLRNDPETSYETYITVQNELVAAYYALRNKVALKKYNKTYKELEAMFEDPKTPEAKRERLEPLVKEIQEMYPQKLSEAEPLKN